MPLCHLLFVRRKPFAIVSDVVTNTHAVYLARTSCNTKRMMSIAVYLVYSMASGRHECTPGQYCPVLYTEYTAMDEVK